MGKNVCAKILRIPVTRIDKREKSFILPIIEEQGRRALCSFRDARTHQILCGYGLPAFVTGHHHSPQPLLHVGEAVGQGQHRHDLAGHRDVKLRLRRQKQRDLVIWMAMSAIKFLQAGGLFSIGLSQRRPLSECLECVRSWAGCSRVASQGGCARLPVAPLSRTRPG